MRNSDDFATNSRQQRAFTNHHVCFGTVMKGCPENTAVSSSSDVALEGMRVVREIGELGTRVS